jgi:hypothetical protein
MFLGTMPLFANGAVLDPTQLALTGLFRDYTNPSWSGTASAGTSGSGSNDLNDPGNEPAQGTALNGHGAADFNGSDDHFTADGTWDTYSAALALSGWVLLKADDVSVSKHNILGVTTNVQAPRLWINSSNVIFEINNSGTQASRAIAAASYRLVTFRYTGSAVQVGVNEAPGAAGGASTAAYSTNATLTGVMAVGSSFEGIALGSFYDGHIAEIGLTDTVLTDGTFQNIKGYINARYGLSL